MGVGHGLPGWSTMLTRGDGVNSAEVGQVGTLSEGPFKPVSGVPQASPTYLPRWQLGDVILLAGVVFIVAWMAAWDLWWLGLPLSGAVLAVVLGGSRR